MRLKNLRTLDPRASRYLRYIATAFVAVIIIIAALIVTQQIGKKDASAQYIPSVDGVAIPGLAVTLEPGVPILIDRNEPAPLIKAVNDLRRDIELVLGQPSPLVHTVAELGNRSAIVVTSQGAETVHFRDTSLTGEESHQVAVRTVNGKNHAVLQGADMRGSIYAVYSFSDKFLGVPALWYWSDWQAEQKSNITIEADSGFRVGTPHTKNRAWFLNNQDLILGWDPLTTNHDYLFETMLRLKLNTFYVGEQLGEYGGPGLSIAERAQGRGMKIAANNLAQFRQWDNYWSNIRRMQPPALTLANKAQFEEFWRFSLEFAKSKNLDVIWVLGFRGKADRPFWDDMADAPTSATARGDVIEEQVARQAALVRQVTGKPDQKMAFLAWGELSELASQGALQFPNDKDITWIFGNEVRDHFPLADVRTHPLPSGQPYGYYMNLQFSSTGAHLAEAEGPWKMAQNFKIVQNRRANDRLDFAYVNMGNVREFLITGASSARMMWDIRAYDASKDMPLLLDDYFGSGNGGAATNLYRSMLNAYWQQKPADMTDIERQYIFHDLRISMAIDKQLNQIIAGKRNLNPFHERLGIDKAHSNANSDVGAVMNGSQAAQVAFAQVASAVDAKLADIPASQQRFYKDTFQSPARFLHQAHRTLYTVTRSHFKIESDKAAAYCSLLDAKGAAQAMREALEMSAHGKFASWYSGESYFGIASIQSKIDTGLSKLPAVTCSGSPLAPAPPEPNKGDLVVKRLVLTNSQGVEKTTFAPGEAIYPKVILANQGTASVPTPSGITYTHIFSNAPNTVAKGTSSDVNVFIQNGQFSTGFEKEYGASGVGPNAGFYKGAKSWTKSQAGTYTARAFINSPHDGVESTFDNNQLTATYTIVSPNSPPPPSPPPAPTPTPTPEQPATLSVEAHPNISGLKTSSVKDGKRTVFRAMRTMTLKRLSCYGCGSGTSFVLRKSSSSYSLGQQIYAGTAQGTNNSWSYVDVDIPVTGGHYYVLEFTPTSTPVYFGSSEMKYNDFHFYRYATAGAPSWKTGSWQIGLGYTK